MDFIVDNYFGFIVGGVAILMIIIGYIAEQTDFGRKPFRKKNENNKETNIATEEPVEVVAEAEVSENDANIENSDEFLFDNGIADIEIPEDVVEGNFDIDEEIEQENNEEVIAEKTLENADNIVEEPMTDFNIPEVTIDNVESPSIVSDVVEEVISNDSEDDVWKF